MACVFKARINPQFNRAGNLKGVAGFKKQTEVLPLQPSVLIVYPTHMLKLGLWCLW